MKLFNLKKNNNTKMFKKHIQKIIIIKIFMKIYYSLLLFIFKNNIIMKYNYTKLKNIFL